MVHPKEQMFDVYWQGPYTVKELGQFKDDSNAALYAIYSAHPLYGRNSLVYIGMTEQGIVARLKQHDWWTSIEAEPIRVHIAYIGELASWAAAEAAETYKRPSKDIVCAVEALLIYAHQPAYNVRSKRAAEAARDFRLFNTGLFGALMPEVSGFYYIQSSQSLADKQPGC